MAPNIRFKRRITRSPFLRAASCPKLSSANEMFADTRSSIETICPSIECGSRRETSNTPTLSPLQISGSAAAAPTWPSLAPSRQGSERGSFRKSLLTHILRSRKACPLTPEPSGVPSTIEMIDATQARDVVATAGRETQEVGFRLQQEDRHSQEVADRERGFADLGVQFLG